VPLRSARQVTLKKMYHTPDSRVSALSQSSLLNNPRPSTCVTIRRDKERLTLRKVGQLWMTVVELLVLAAVTGC
jgi:hypothetical protein